MTTITTQLADALRALMRMDVRGHQLQDRLQFSDAGRALLNPALEALAAYDAQQACGHSACSQHYIDTGSRDCVQG